MLGFYLTAYDLEQESIEDPDYGRLVAYYVTWGFDDVPNEEKTVIPTSTCTPEQLGVYPNGTLSGKQDLFYPVHPNSQNDLKFFHKKFQCFDSEKITLHGDYNSAKTRNLLIAFEMCD